MSIARLFRSMSVVSTGVICTLLAGCLAIPIPFRPGSTVVPNPGSADEPDFELHADDHWPWGESLAKSVAHGDPRIVIVDAEEFLTAAFPDGHRTLSRLLLRQDPASNQSFADCVLFLGTIHAAKPTDAGFGPSLLGYDKTQRAESAAALLVDLHRNTRPRSFFVESHYADTTAGVGVVGFATIGNPDSAIRLGLTMEVIRRLAEAEPAGPLRLVVLPYFADRGLNGAQ